MADYVNKRREMEFEEFRGEFQEIMNASYDFLTYLLENTFIENLEDGANPIDYYIDNEKKVLLAFNIAMSQFEYCQVRDLNREVSFNIKNCNISLKS